MSNEANVRTGLEIIKGNLSYRKAATQFNADINAATPGGPSPGTVTATTTGVNVSLSALVNPSLCVIENLSAVAGNYVTVGIWDGTEFYPVLELLPGESYVVRLSRLLGQSIGAGTGTGTYDAGVYSLRLRSATAEAKCNVLAFDR